ncbi:MAG: metallophosphoesterase, partial [Gammaproteobacteria bacterium]|nr:metallophosphoesterase [Gammaproteobacteria bacterium]
MRAALEARVGALHLRQRLGIEEAFEAKLFGQSFGFFHLENWYSVHAFIRNSLRLVGLYRRGQRNALDLRLREHDLVVRGLPAAFEGYRILHLSDLHLDMRHDFPHQLIESVRGLQYDLCVLTGDYRGRTYGCFEAALNALALVRTHLSGPVYGILGNHDTIRLVPGMEAMGVRM